jgi:hypothetical protein
MTSPTNRPLKQNPFTTHRDPQTGRWIVVHSDAVSSPPHNDHSRKEPALTVLDGGISERRVKRNAPLNAEASQASQ